jgi:epimerase EvaD
MRVRELEVEGAFAFEPPTFPDDRGMFVAPFQEAAFAETVGIPRFPLAQGSTTVSRRGVVRGIHFTATPPGMAKYVWCLGGRGLDIVVDLRVGSPTFGRWDSAELDGDSYHAVYVPFGVGHAFVSLADDSVMLYMMSTGYVPENELAVLVTDPELGLPIPEDLDIVVSDRDRAAPTLAEAKRRGLLPDYATCSAMNEKL